jgi:hypothetical protein
MGGIFSHAFFRCGARSDDVRCSCHCTRDPERFSRDSAMRLTERASSVFEANQFSKIFGDTEQLDRDLACCFGPRIASQPLCPRETSMGTLSTGERRGSESARGIPCLPLDRHPLAAKQLDTGTPMNPATPVTPKDWSRTDRHGMQQHTHLARLCCRTAIPLTLLAQRARTATANAGRIHMRRLPSASRRRSWG